MTKVFAVVGAAGVQGASVVEAIKKLPGWRIRALTRNTESPTANALRDKGFEVVQADANSKTIMLKAFEGANAVFAVTNWWEHISHMSLNEAGELEQDQAMTIARAAAETESLEQFFWSTLQDSSLLTGRQFSLPHVDYKAKVDDRIRAELPELAAKTTFCVVPYYTQNIAMFPFLQPFEIPNSGGHWVNMLPVAPATRLPMTGDVSVNVGIYIRQALLAGSKAKGKYVRMVKEVWTVKAMVDEWARIKGVKCSLVRCTPEMFAEIWGPYGEEMASQFEMYESSDPDVVKGGPFITDEELDIDLEELVGSTEALERFHAAGKL